MGAVSSNHQPPCYEFVEGVGGQGREVKNMSFALKNSGLSTERDGGSERQSGTQAELKERPREEMVSSLEKEQLQCQ